MMNPHYPAPLHAALDRRPIAWRIGAILVGSWLLAASSWIEAPMYPVPMTMQTYAVLLIAGMAGARLSVEIVLAWLVQAAVGLPVLAGGAGGLAPFMGPTAGYLMGFLAAATICGWLTEQRAFRGWVAMGMVFLAGHAVILTLGWAWLAGLTDARTAFAAGVVPFLAGSVLKTILAVATIKLADPVARRALGG